MTARRALRGATLGALLATALMACGQRGPLMLPGDARPVEPLAPPATESEEAQDEEGENER